MAGLLGKKLKTTPCKVGVARRDKPKIVPWENPFDKMELSYKRKNSRSRTKGRDNGEHKLRPTPARQSSTQILSQTAILARIEAALVNKRSRGTHAQSRLQTLGLLAHRQDLRESCHAMQIPAPPEF